MAMDNGQWTMDNGEDGLGWLTMAVYMTIGIALQ